MCYFEINNNHNGKLSYGKKKKMYMYFIGKEKETKNVGNKTVILL